jgi:hypothetical protein
MSTLETPLASLPGVCALPEIFALFRAINGS